MKKQGDTTEDFSTTVKRKPEQARILILIAEQIQRLQEQGIICLHCQTTTKFNPHTQQATTQTGGTEDTQGISITCELCQGAPFF
jgi:hypothetical protein